MKKHIVFVVTLLSIVVFNVNSTVNKSYFYQSQVKTQVSELAVSDISKSKARLSFIICGMQINEVGVCYGSSENPTVAGGKKVTNYEGDAYDILKNISYKTRITGLDEGKVYFARAYVKNKAGKIFYSDEVSFKTEKDETDYNAMLNGVKKDFYPNGVVMKEYTLKDGQVEGNMRFYNEEGVLVADECIKNGIQNGTCKYYHPNRQLKTQILLTNGIQNGKSTEYDSEGTLTTESNLIGTPPEFNGEVKHFFRNGQISDITNISGGKLSSSIHYDIEGRVTSEITPQSTTDYSYDRDGWKHTTINGEKCTCARCSENSHE